jgi:excisionase family DNA binding protein
MKRKATSSQSDAGGFNLARAAAYLGTSRPTLSRMLKDEVIPHRRYKKRIFISREALDSFLSGEK